MEFERSTTKPRQIGLTPLIDVVFLLIIFFMLSTSFIRTESMELSFPKSAETKAAVTADELIRIFVVDENRIFLGEKEMTMPELKAQLRLALFKDPERGILLLSGEVVSVQRIISVMDDIYLMGGRNVSVAYWKANMGGPKIAPAEPAP
ncbi:MAG: ExbD/TolR family protein [Rickettsiales bacterium]